MAEEQKRQSPGRKFGLRRLQDVLFRTDGSSRLGVAVISDQPVSFEIDGVDAGRRAGWSVLVQGTAAEVGEQDAAELEATGSAPQPWAPGSRRQVVRIVPYAISGRRIRPVPGWRWTQLSEALVLGTLLGSGGRPGGDVSPGRAAGPAALAGKGPVVVEAGPVDVLAG